MSMRILTVALATLVCVGTACNQPKTAKTPDSAKTKTTAKTEPKTSAKKTDPINSGSEKKMSITVADYGTTKSGEKVETYIKTELLE